MSTWKKPVGLDRVDLAVDRQDAPDVADQEQARPRAKVSRSNFIFCGGRNSGVANDVFRRKNEI